MIPYDTYKHLLGQPYIDGEQDCYGLIRSYYRDVYEIEIKNWARPIDAFRSGMDLLGGRLSDEGFELTQDSLDRLHVGDLLLIAIGCKVANHTAVYVGNNYILHHLADKPSSEDTFSGAWKQRVLSAVRHPFVTEANAKGMESADLLQLLPEHVKLRHGIITPLG